MELKDLVGEHELSGVDVTIETIEQYRNHYVDCTVVLFVLDGKTYKAMENHEDGHRSWLKKLEVSDEKVTNRFPPQKVMCKKKNDSKWEKNDVIEFIDVTTGKVVLEVGTYNTEDYYPYCVIRWLPENLAINIGK